MANYIQVTFPGIDEKQSELVVALLVEAGYEGFEELPGALTAFIPSELFQQDQLDEVVRLLAMEFQIETIAESNWNEKWEKSFQPVVIGGFVGIRAEFHPPVTHVKHEIIITPKMSFGTGHHATTSMMIDQMSEMDLQGKKVFDFGTGTGILAILAEKLGADSILAVDNDEWSIRNATENIQKNGCQRVRVHRPGQTVVNESFDVILANINKNIILDNIADLFKKLNRPGILLLSGLLVEDETDIRQVADLMGFQIIRRLKSHNWLSLKLSSA